MSLCFFKSSFLSSCNYTVVPSRLLTFSLLSLSFTHKHDHTAHTREVQHVFSCVFVSIFSVVFPFRCPAEITRQILPPAHKHAKRQTDRQTAGWTDVSVSSSHPFITLPPPNPVTMVAVSPDSRRVEAEREPQRVVVKIKIIRRKGCW